MALKIILPLHEFIENLINRSALFFYAVDQPSPVNHRDARTIVHHLVDDALSHSFNWAPTVDSTTTLLEELYPWMTTHAVFASRFYQDCVDPLDARLTDILARYVPNRTNDVWSVSKQHDDIILENLGNHASGGNQSLQERLQALLQEQLNTQEQSLPKHRNNATTYDDLRAQLTDNYNTLTHDVLRLIVDKDLNLTE